MLAALSLVDRGLVDRLISESFPHRPPASAVDGDTGSKDKDSRRGPSAEAKAYAITVEIRDKVLATIEACREMLAKEPPERRSYWHEVMR